MFTSTTIQLHHRENLHFKKKKKTLPVLLITKYYHSYEASTQSDHRNCGIKMQNKRLSGFLTDLKDTTGPTSRQISISCSSVASYGIFPTVTEILPNESINTTPKTLTSEISHLIAIETVSKILKISILLNLIAVLRFQDPVLFSFPAISRQPN